MRVTVRYMAQLRRAAGAAEEAADLGAGATLGDLLAAVAGRHGDAFRRALLGPDGRPQPALLLFVGDERADVPHPLRDGDRVTILTPMAGG